MKTLVGTQVYVVQGIMTEFIEANVDSFECFQRVWRNNNGNQIHELDGEKPLLYGRSQSAAITFLGYLKDEYGRIAQSGSIYGFYMTSETNRYSTAPIFFSPVQIPVLKALMQENEIVRQIFSYLVQNERVCFTSVDYSYEIRSIRCPSKWNISRKQVFKRYFAKEKKNKDVSVDSLPTLPQYGQENAAEYSKLLRELRR